MGFGITFFDLRTDMQVEMRNAFQDIDKVHDVAWSFYGLAADAIVSPANSFGFMDGGVDLAYSEYFGWQVEHRVREEIKKLPFNELLIGQALVVDTDHLHVPKLICAPTMRVPMYIFDSIDVYLAARAAFKIAKDNDWHILMPGLGTGCGLVPVAIAAQRMRQAYDDVVNERQFVFKDFYEARNHHMLTK